jgi:hypothetical protein
VLRVRVLRKVTTPFVVYVPGDLSELPGVFARALIRAGLAEPLDVREVAALTLPRATTLPGVEVR